MDLAAQLRAGYAKVLGCDAEEVALTGSTTDGVNTVLAGLDLRAGDEVITSDEEHPGLLAPLGRLRGQRGVEVRVVPFAEVAGAVSSNTRLVAVSHVSWVSGRVADCAALRETGVPFLLDAAQSIGAVPANVRELGCAFYAGSGQKWLCGPEGSGSLYVHPDHLEDLSVPWPGYASLADAHDALNSPPAETAKRLDHGFPPGMRSTWALASLAVFESAGWEWVQGRAIDLAASLASQLAERGVKVWPRGSFDAGGLGGRGRRRRGGPAGRRRLRRAQYSVAWPDAGVGGRLVLGGGTGRARQGRRRLNPRPPATRQAARTRRPCPCRCRRGHPGARRR